MSADQAGKSPRHGAGDMSLAERAAVAASAELRGERARILGARGRSGMGLLAPPRRVPDCWSFVHVMDRMEEAFRTLGRLPMQTRPRGYMNSMPTYLYDRGDLNAQLDTHELERMAKIRNHVRIRPSPAEIERSEEALHWPAAFLSGAEFHHVARAVNLSAMWVAFETDVDAALKRIKLGKRAFNARKLQGLRIIAAELVRRRVPVR